MADYEVVWSGSSWRLDPPPQIGTLSDRYIAGQVRRTVQKQPSGPTYRAARDAVLVCLKHGASCVRDIRATTGFRRTTLWTVIRALEREGQITVERQKQRLGRPRVVLRFVG